MHPLSSTPSLLPSESEREDHQVSDPSNLNLWDILDRDAALDIELAAELQLPAIFPSPIPLSLPTNPSSLEQEIMGLRNQNMEMMKRNLILEGQFNTFREAYYALLNRVKPNIGDAGLRGQTDVASASTSISAGATISNDSELEPLALQATDFPNVKFWLKRNWSRAANVKGLSRFNYLEKEDGVMVDETRLHEMREVARNMWKGFKKQGILPPTWRSARVEVRSEYYREMRQKFLEFRLCETDWKADQLAADYYYSFHNYHAKGKGRQGEGIGTMEPVAKRMKTGAEPEQMSSNGEPSCTTSLDSYFAPSADAAGLFAPDCYY